MTAVLAYTSGPTDVMHPASLDDMGIVFTPSPFGKAHEDTEESQAWGAISLEYHVAGYPDVAEFCNWMAGADKPEGLNETECLWQLYDDDMLPVPARNFPCLMIARPDGY